MHLAKLWVASSLLPLLSSHDGLSGMRARRRMGRIGMRAPGKVVSRHGRAQPRMYISRLPARQTKYSIPLWSIRFEKFDIKRPIFRGIIDTIKDKGKDEMNKYQPVFAAAGIKITRVPRSFGVEISLTRKRSGEETDVDTIVKLTSCRLRQ